MNKKALELSINFIVMLIITIVVFSLGIIFLRNIFTIADDTEAQFTAQMERELEDAMFRGERVAIPINYAEMRVGDTKTFGLGILNQLGEEKQFEVNIEFDTSVPDSLQDTSEWTFEELPTDGYFNIKNNEFEKIALLFKVPGGTSPGTYIFNVNVYYDDTKYDTTHQIRIKVL
jgi:hypothetical protein